MARRILLSFVLVLVGNHGLATVNDNPPACVSTGFVKEPICSVPLVALLARPSEYDGAFVRVKGFLSAGVPAVLFVSKEAHDSSDAASSIVIWGEQLKSLELGGLTRASVEVVGKFSAERLPAPEILAQGEFHSGSILDVLNIRNAESAWGSVPVHIDPPPGYLSGSSKSDATVDSDSGVSEER